MVAARGAPQCTLSPHQHFLTPDTSVNLAPPEPPIRFRATRRAPAGHTRAASGPVPNSAPALRRRAPQASRAVHRDPASELHIDDKHAPQFRPATGSHEV